MDNAEAHSAEKESNSPRKSVSICDFCHFLLNLWIYFCSWREFAKASLIYWCDKFAKATCHLADTRERKFRNSLNCFINYDYLHVDAAPFWKAPPITSDCFSTGLKLHRLIPQLFGQMSMAYHLMNCSDPSNNINTIWLLYWWPIYRPFYCVPRVCV